jgi:hypothetical protein
LVKNLSVDALSVQVKNYLLKNCPSEKESGGELCERRIIQRKNHPAKNYPVKNVSNKNEAKNFRRGIVQLKDCPAKNCQREKLSSEELSG